MTTQRFTKKLLQLNVRLDICAFLTYLPSVQVAYKAPSLSVAEQFYRTDPQKYPYLEPLQTWPWKRTAYAQVIERLMAAGARSVAVDVMFANPSSYGVADDERLARVLQRYAD